MGKKYIIELKDRETLYKAAIKNGEPYVTIALGKPYTGPDLEQVRREGYQQGLNDAREGKATCEFCEYEMCSDRVNPCRICARNYTNFFEPKKQEQEKEEIKVGDEVIRHYKNEFIEGDDAPSIFLSEEDGNFRCIAFNGRSIIIADYPKHQYRKTGRHFPEIAAVLKKMKGEADD